MYFRKKKFKKKKKKACDTRISGEKIKPINFQLSKELLL